MPPKGGKRNAKKAYPKPRGLATTPGVNTALTAPMAAATVVRKERVAPVPIIMREEVSDVTVFAGKFANSPMVINPANEELFPFLSKIAVHFESYEFPRLNFEYAANASSGDAGTVAIAVNPNPDDPPFETMKETLNREGAINGAPWTNIEAKGKFATSSSIKRKYVEDVTGAKALSNVLDDLHTVADGVVNVVTAGLNILGVNNLDVVIDGVPLTVQLDSTVTGKFYVNYHCLLYDPILREAEDDNLVSNNFVDSKSWFGSNDTWVGNDGLRVGVAYQKSTPNTVGFATFTFPETGTYMLVANQNFTVATTNCIVGLGPPTVDSSTGAKSIAAAANQGFIASGGNHWLSTFVVFEILAENGVVQIPYSISTDQTPTDPLTGGYVYLTKVNNSTSVLTLLGKMTDSPLDCPNSKGFLHLHKIARQSEGLKAATLGMQMARNSLLHAVEPKRIVRVVQKSQIIDKSKVKLVQTDTKTPNTATEVVVPLSMSPSTPPQNAVTEAKTKIEDKSNTVVANGNALDESYCVVNKAKLLEKLGVLMPTVAKAVQSNSETSKTVPAAVK